MNDINITGTEIAYLYLCKRKLWFFRHGIKPENENVNVQIGKHIQETSFEREEKDIPIGEIGVIDWAAFRHGIIHETKKGKSPGQGDEAQVRYYMHWLNSNGINIKEAQIHYPTSRKTHTLEWNPEIDAKVQDDLAECLRVVSLDSPPPLIEFPYCKSCAYQEICFA